MNALRHRPTAPWFYTKHLAALFSCSPCTPVSPKSHIPSISPHIPRYSHIPPYLISSQIPSVPPLEPQRPALRFAANPRLSRLRALRCSHRLSPSPPLRVPRADNQPCSKQNLSRGQSRAAVPGRRMSAKERGVRCSQKEREARPPMGGTERPNCGLCCSNKSRGRLSERMQTERVKICALLCCVMCGLPRAAGLGGTNRAGAPAGSLEVVS